jgi:hypothetical protein
MSKMGQTSSGLLTGWGLISVCQQAFMAHSVPSERAVGFTCSAA